MGEGEAGDCWGDGDKGDGEEVGGGEGDKVVGRAYSEPEQFPECVRRDDEDVVDNGL